MGKSEFELPLSCDCAKCRGAGAAPEKQSNGRTLAAPTISPEVIAQFLPLLMGGKHDGMVEAIMPLLQGKKPSIEMLLPLLPMLFKPRESLPMPDKEQAITINDFKRLD